MHRINKQMQNACAATFLLEINLACMKQILCTERTHRCIMHKQSYFSLRNKNLHAQKKKKKLVHEHTQNEQAELFSLEK